MDAERQAAQTNLKIGGINHFAIQVEDRAQAVSTLAAKASRLSQGQKMFRTVAGTASPSFTTMSACWLSSCSLANLREAGTAPVSTSE